MTVAVVVLAVVIVALLVDRHRTHTEFAKERRELVAAVLSRSAGEFAAATRTEPRPPREPVEPIVGI